MVEFLPTSAFSLESLDLEYSNSSRKLQLENNALSSGDFEFTCYDALSCVCGYSKNENSISLLTCKRQNPLGVSSCYVKYDLNNLEGLGLDCDNVVELENNYLININCANEDVNVIPLKNTLNSKYNYSCDINNRCYETILNTQDEILLSYSSNIGHLTFESDSINRFIYPHNAKEVCINEMDFMCMGAIAGSTPCNSDVICSEEYEYNKATKHICSWLSASDVDPCSAVWMDRFYDNGLSEDALNLIPKFCPPNECEHIHDVVSTTKLKPKSKYSYIRRGSESNSSYLDTLSSDLAFAYASYNDSTITDCGANGINGRIIQNGQ